MKPSAIFNLVIGLLVVLIGLFAPHGLTTADISGFAYINVFVIGPLNLAGAAYLSRKRPQS